MEIDLVIGTRLFHSLPTVRRKHQSNIYKGKKIKDQRREDLLDQWQQPSSVVPTLQMWPSKPGAQGAAPSSQCSPQVAGDTVGCLPWVLLEVTGQILATWIAEDGSLGVQQAGPLLEL